MGRQTSGHTWPALGGIHAAAVCCSSPRRIAHIYERVSRFNVNGWGYEMPHLRPRDAERASTHVRSFHTGRGLAWRSVYCAVGPNSSHSLKILLVPFLLIRYRSRGCRSIGSRCHEMGHQFGDVNTKRSKSGTGCGYGLEGSPAKKPMGNSRSNSSSNANIHVDACVRRESAVVEVVDIAQLDDVDRESSVFFQHLSNLSLVLLTGEIPHDRWRP